MNIIHQKINLDVNDSGSDIILNAHQGDNKTRFIDISLTMSGESIVLSADYTAVIKASNNGTVKAIDQCTVNTEDNIVIAELTNIMLDTPGILNCEITVCHGDQLVTSCIFKVNVARSTVPENGEIEKSEKFGLLTKLICDVENIEENAEVVKDMLNRIAQVQDLDKFVNSKLSGYDDWLHLYEDKPYYTLVDIADLDTPGLYALHTYIPAWDTENTYEPVRTIVYKTLHNTYIANVNNGDKPLIYNISTSDLKDENAQSLLVRCNCIPDDIPVKVSQLKNDKFYINSIGDRFDKNQPCHFTKIQNEDGKLCFYGTPILSNTPSDVRTYSSNYINSLLSAKADKSEIPKNVSQISNDKNYMTENEIFMAFAGLIKNVSGKGLITLPDTADSKLISAQSQSDILIKNKNVFEYKSNIGGINCTVGLNNDEYIISPKGEDFYISWAVASGGRYSDGLGALIRYAPCVITMSNNIFNRHFITYFDENMVSLGFEMFFDDIKTEIVLDGKKENAKYFTIRAGSSKYSEHKNESLPLKIQVEYGQQATDYATPKQNSQGITYEGGSNIICDSECTVRYVPDIIGKLSLL